MYEPIWALWSNFASVNCVITDCNDGLMSVWHQAITSTNAYLLMIKLVGTKFSEITIKNRKLFIENMESKMSSAKYQPFCSGLDVLAHWGWVTHICISNLTTIGGDNGLSPGRPQAIISTNDGILLIGSLGINFSDILIKIHTFSFKKMYWKLSSAKWPRFCLGLNVLTHLTPDQDGKCRQLQNTHLWNHFGF